MEPAGGDQVDGPSEQIGEVIGEPLDDPAQTSNRRKHIQDADVDIAASRAADVVTARDEGCASDTQRDAIHAP
ncbi:MULTISPECIES: hypothetical protein [Parafrankia]|uniref:hypothetical protein n=1 Tax=Parafrankia TaxID=2994362 RepID=UPI001041D7D1|nr:MULTISPECIES: hypothetical protein [Parafrankia]MBE3202293.1 hypothetical protein [Parafrankia sp. CH37]